MTDALNQLDADTTNLVTGLAALQARIADLTEQAEGLKAEIRARLAAGDYGVGDAPMVRITPTRRFDEVAALALVPETDRQACLAVKVDAAKVRAHLTPVQVEAHMVEVGKPKVAVL